MRTLEAERFKISRPWSLSFMREGKVRPEEEEEKTYLARKGEGYGCPMTSPRGKSLVSERKQKGERLYGFVRGRDLVGLRCKMKRGKKEVLLEDG